MQSFRPCAGNQIFRAGHAVTGKKGVGVEVDIERHRATTLICSAKNGKHRFQGMVAGVQRARDTGHSRSSCAKAELRKDVKDFSFRRREFFLFPTFFHEQIAKVRIAAADIAGARQHDRNSMVCKSGAGVED